MVQGRWSRQAPSPASSSIGSASDVNTSSRLTQLLCACPVNFWKSANDMPNAAASSPSLGARNRRCCKCCTSLSTFLCARRVLRGTQS